MSGGRKVILCIDDDVDFLAYLRMTLESAGYKVIEALSGQDGLAKLSQDKPDLIIVDLMMEELDSGAAFCSAARKILPDVPVYLLSSMGDKLSSVADATQLGFTGILQKPFSQERLLNIVGAQFENATVG